MSDMTAGVRVEGLRELQKSLRKLDPEARKLLNRELRVITRGITLRVRSQMPARSGNARMSVRPGVWRGDSVIRAGGSRAPYYGWLDFGGTLRPSGGRRNTQHRPVFKSGRYIYPTIARSRPQLVDAAREAIVKAERRVF
jgi:hypothetical protein